MSPATGRLCRLLDDDPVVGFLPYDFITLFEPEFLAEFLRNGDLPFSRDAGRPLVGVALSIGTHTAYYDWWYV